MPETTARPVRMRLAVLLAAAVTMLSLALAAAVPALAAVPASASSTPVVYQAAGPAAVRPRTFSISRGVASVWFMSSLRWSRWNRSSAAGRGREYDSRSRARITLWRVRTHDGTRYYSRLTVHAPRGFTSGRLRWSWSSHEWALGS
jgi:hypothetical protein